MDPESNDHDMSPTSQDPAAGEGILEAIPELYGLADGDENRTLRWTLGVALLFHLVLLIVHIPNLFRPGQSRLSLLK